MVASIQYWHLASLAQQGRVFVAEPAWCHSQRKAATATTAATASTTATATDVAATACTTPAITVATSTTAAACCY